MAFRPTIWVLVFALEFSLVPTAVSQSPFQLTPSVRQYGPDGPWWAVNVKIGEPQQSLDLLPAVNAESYVLTQPLCSHNSKCGQGGLYNIKNSSSSINVHVGGSTNGAPLTLGSIETNATSAAVLDTLTLFSPLAPTSAEAVSLSVANFSFFGLSSLEEVLGHGVNYPLQTGQLSLGPPTSRTVEAGNGSVIPEAFELQNATSSDSFGLHYGSANLNQPLSLWMGGYDQQRVVGPVSTQPADNQFNLPIDLLDIGIGVATGGSPFPFSSQSGLLAAKNTSIGSHVTVYMYPALPFLSLPNSTCNAIAALLPVTYNYTLGLYLWDTNAPSYDPIRNSPAYLNFTFRASASLTQNITINVPFSLLNLTLTPPLVSSPVAYFPCQPPAAGAKFALGRAFLQAAFVGAYWDQLPGSWFLAQAPGPIIPSQASPVEFENATGSVTVTGSSNQWIDTWKDVWTPLPSGNSAAAATSSSAATGDLTSGSSLSGGAIAGIVIGVLVAVGLLLAGAFLLFTRRRRQQRQQRNFAASGAGAGAGAAGDGAAANNKDGYASGSTVPGLVEKHAQEPTESSPFVELDPGRGHETDGLREMEAQGNGNGNGHPVELFGSPNSQAGTELDGADRGEGRDSRVSPLVS